MLYTQVARRRSVKLGAGSLQGIPIRPSVSPPFVSLTLSWVPPPIGDARTGLRHCVLYTDFVIGSSCLLCRVKAAKKGTRVIQCTFRECTRFALFLVRVVCVRPLPMLYESKPVFVRSLLLTTKVYVCISKKTSSVFVGHPNLKQCQ